MATWLAVGHPDDWRTARERGIWGLAERHVRLWQETAPGDEIVFYATWPVRGIIGHGRIESKFRSGETVWPRELAENRVIWPYRLRLRIEYLLPEELWGFRRVESEPAKRRAQGGFQRLEEKLASRVIAELVERETSPELTPVLQGFFRSVQSVLEASSGAIRWPEDEFRTLLKGMTEVLMDNAFMITERGDRYGRSHQVTLLVMKEVEVFTSAVERDSNQPMNPELVRSRAGQAKTIKDTLEAHLKIPSFLKGVFEIVNELLNMVK